MKHEYSIHRKNIAVAAVNDIVLSESSTTRLIMRSELVDNSTDGDHSVHTRLMHQRRSPSMKTWEDAEPFKLASVPAGQEIRLILDAAETSTLMVGLMHLYEIYRQNGLPVGREHIAVVDTETSLVISGREKQALEELLASEGERFWDLIEELNPGMLEAVNHQRQLAERREAVEIFHYAMENEEWDEKKWERFFKGNRWIFGHSLVYQFLSDLTNQAHVGGEGYEGVGGQITDFLMATGAAGAGFIVVVDIKKPTSRLLSNYRDTVYRPSSELSGGTAQIQSYCHTWTIDGSQRLKTRQALQKRQIYTYQPKGILVIGTTTELGDDLDKVGSFELYRRNLHNPEIITFDELLARANALISPDGS